MTAGAAALFDSNSAAAKFHYFENEDSKVNSVAGAVTTAAALAIASAAASASTSSIASSSKVPVTQEQIQFALKQASEFCHEVDYSGTDLAGKIDAKFNASLPKISKKLGLDASASAEASLKAAHYSGPDRSGVPDIVRSTQDCKEHVSDRILDIFFVSDSRSEASRPNVTATANARSGDQIQSQSQFVQVNTKIPRIAVVPQPFASFGDAPAYTLVPEPDPSEERAASSAPATTDTGERGNRCQDRSDNAAAVAAPLELIMGRPRCAYFGAPIAFASHYTSKGHEQVVLASNLIWDGLSVSIPRSKLVPTKHGEVLPVAPPDVVYDAIAVPENGGTSYLMFGGHEYIVTVGPIQEPDDGSPPRVDISLKADGM